MRIIPVIDLRKGLAVHAAGGDRARYAPVRTGLCHSSDPLSIARTFRDRLGLKEIYIADLDAIQGKPSAAHIGLITKIAADEDLRVMLDAAISTIDNARAWMDIGITKAVIAAETLRSPQDLYELPAAIPADRLVFSLDIRGGKVLSRCPELAELSPMRALELLSIAGWREVILLDLDRVGSETGVDRRFLLDALTKFPDLQLMVGGGIAGPEQLHELKDMGISGALLATALHRGTINAVHISRLSPSGYAPQ